MNQGPLCISNMELTSYSMSQTFSFMFCKIESYVIMLQEGLNNMLYMKSLAHSGYDYEIKS